MAYPGSFEPLHPQRDWLDRVNDLVLGPDWETDPVMDRFNRMVLGEAYGHPDKIPARVDPLLALLGSGMVNNPPRFLTSGIGQGGLLPSAPRLPADHPALAAPPPVFNPNTRWERPAAPVGPQAPTRVSVRELDPGHFAQLLASTFQYPGAM